ncbi:MAG: OmpA family protein [Marinilabiliaceae bacterium]|nr:OmpA family protein [Marinilabiliaceae bacterium]
MSAKIRVHGRAQSRTVLGIVNAYIKLNPTTTLEQLNAAFPGTLHSSNRASIFADPNVVLRDGKNDYYFEHEDELVKLPDGTLVAMAEKWVKDDYDKVVELAKSYGIEAELEMTGSFERGGFTLEILEEAAQDDAAECKSCKWLCSLILLAALILLSLLLFKFCSDCPRCDAEDEAAKRELEEQSFANATIEAEQACQQGVDELAAKMEELKKSIEGASVRFQKANAGFTSESYEALDKIVEYMKATPEASLEVVGHASPEGNADYNQQLSEKRAQGIVDYLKAKGVPEAQLTAIGVGATKLLDGDDNVNRCVEFNLK